jgi:uncharacterized protein (TIGR03437 family)
MPAVNAPLGLPYGIAIDSGGSVYVSDPATSLVLKIDLQGTLTVVAGNGTKGYSGDGGPAANAALNGPFGLAFDSHGNLYIADNGNNCVRKMTPDGIISTVVRGGTSTLNFPFSVAVDGAGNLFVQGDGGTVNKITPDGIVTTPAGLSYGGVALDPAGNLYVCSAVYQGVFKVTPGGQTTKLTSTDSLCFGLAADAAGDVYVSAGSFTDNGSGSLFATTSDIVDKIAPDGTVTRIAGVDQAGFSGDGGKAASAELNGPSALAIDAHGAIYIADGGNGRLRVVSSGGTITTVAGNGRYGFAGENSPAISAALNGPAGLAVDSTGNLLIADTGNNRVRKVNSAGIITTIAGDGNPTFAGDGGPPLQASIFLPDGLAAAADGSLFVADAGNNRVRKIGPDNRISTLVRAGANTAGDSYCFLGYAGPAGLALDSSGNLYAADPDPVVRKVLKIALGAGTVTDMIGGFSCPYGVAVDPSGNLFVADRSGLGSTLAGNQVVRIAPDGTRTVLESRFSRAGLTTDQAGNLYMAGGGGAVGEDAVLKIAPDGAITTIAGGVIAGYAGDGGPAVAAQLLSPTAVAVDGLGNLFIADTGNNRIREVLAIPPAVQVSAANLNFSGQATGAPAPTQSFSIASVPGLAFSLTVTTATGGNWLSVTPQSGAAPRLINVVADPSTLTSPGTYQGTITIATPNASPPISTVKVTFQVSPALPAFLVSDPQRLSFSFAKSTPALSQRLTISNSGGGTVSFTAAATITTPTGAKWLTLSQTSGQATPSSPAILTVTADPTGLGVGTFTGTIVISAAGSTTLSVPVTITVSASSQAILLSQRGLFFTAVAQGGVIPPQTFAVLNIGTGVVAWTAKAIPIPATPAWFSVSPTSGNTDAAQSPPAVTVTVDPSKLSVAGTYYGLVEVDAPNAANSPQVLTVVLQLLPAGANTGAALTPGSMLFTAAAGASSPGSQNVLAYNITANAKSFRSVVSADPGLTLVTLPTDATLDPQNPTPIVVQPFTSGLGPGVYTGVVTLQFDDGRVVRLTVKVIVTNSAGASSGGIPGSNARAGGPADATACTPTKLQPILTAPNDAFTGATGFGIKLGVFVKDDCGNPLQSGSVTVSFSNGDTTSTLQPLQGGLWEGTWNTHNPSASVNLIVHATNPQGTSGDLQTNGTLASQTPPAFEDAGIISVFGGATFAPLAPGEVISIYGSGLAETALAAPPAPLSATLVDTQVFIGLRPLPLYYVSDTQVNAVVPYSLANNSLNAPLQIVVQRGNTLSQPVYVNVATAEPTIYSGGNAVTSYPASGGSPYIVSATSPAHAGDTLVLYCLGLGAVTPPVADGGLPTAAGSQAVAAVQVLIGNQPAVVAQALSPQYPGLYQVNAVIPAGVTKGNSVPVTISLSGQTSPPILIPIQ